jgi:hypothetical protein
MILKYNIHKNKSQNKSVYKYMKLERMLLLYAHVDFNKTSLKF